MTLYKTNQGILTINEKGFSATCKIENGVTVISIVGEDTISEEIFKETIQFLLHRSKEKKEE